MSAVSPDVRGTVRVRTLYFATVPCENETGRKEPFVAAAVTVRILLVDDFEPWRRQVCSMLRVRPDLSVVAEAGDGVEAVQKTTELQPDLILLDIGLPTLNGIEAARWILRLVPAAIILFISLNNDPFVVEGAMRTGAKGYVWKQDAMTDLLPAVEAVLRGAHFVSTRLAKA